MWLSQGRALILGDVQYRAFAKPSLHAAEDREAISPLTRPPFNVPNNALYNLTSLMLAEHNIGDAGMFALSEALSEGALPHLTLLDLDRNEIGDPGCAALADAFAMGALAQCRELYLNGNQIGDQGMKALSSALVNGALAKCVSIHLAGNPASYDAEHAVRDALKRRWLDGEFLATHFNEATQLGMSHMKWGDAEMSKLAAALQYCHAKGSLKELRRLFLNNNTIGDAGVASLAGACDDGALASINFIDLDKNQATDAGQQAMRNVAEARGFLIDF